MYISISILCWKSVIFLALFCWYLSSLSVLCFILFYIKKKLSHCYVLELFFYVYIDCSICSSISTNKILKVENEYYLFIVLNIICDLKHKMLYMLVNQIKTFKLHQKFTTQLWVVNLWCNLIVFIWFMYQFLGANWNSIT